MTLRVKNTSGTDQIWIGQFIANDAYYEIQAIERIAWSSDTKVFDDIASGDLTVNNGLADITEALDGWLYLQGNRELPLSDIDNKKLAVHPTYKPRVEDGVTYAVWTGSGDHPSTGAIGEGDLLEFNMTTGTSIVSVDVKFHSDNGRVWIHEGYLKFEGGGLGDYVCANFVAEPTPLQTSVNLDLEIADNWVTLAAGGPGTGTHGFADGTKIALVPRFYSSDGDWDFDGTNLTPNVGGTGEYKISDLERNVHTFIQHIPCLGSSSTYFSMSSDETAELLANYFVRVSAHNVSNTNWTAASLIEIYRERTCIP